MNHMAESGKLDRELEFLPNEEQLLERDAQGELLANCRADLGLDRPAVTRYLDWAGSALRGDLGLSVDGKTSITGEVALRVKNSILLAAGALSVGVPLAVILGVIGGLWRDRFPDLLVSTALAIEKAGTVESEAWTAAMHEVRLAEAVERSS